MKKNFLLITSCIVVSIWTNFSILYAEQKPENIINAARKKPFSATELFSGKRVDFPCDPEKFCIISFFSEKTSNSVFDWLSILPFEQLDPQKIEFINVLFPGGIFFMIPQPKALNAIRKQVTAEIQKNLQNSPPEQQKIFHSLNIKWVADLQRKLFRSWNLDANESWFFFFAPGNNEPTVYRGFSRLQSLDFLIRLHLGDEFSTPE
jgi:hypothetical protein